MNKIKQFQNAAKKLSYWDVIQAFNKLNERLGGEYYTSSTNLITPDGKKVPGFIYTGSAAGIGIRNILDILNIKYITYMKDGSGIDEHSEIHIIDSASQKRMLDIFEKCGNFSANVYMKKHRYIPIDPLLLQHIR